MVGQCKDEYNLQDGWIFLNVIKETWKISVYVAGDYGRRFYSAILSLMGQEKCIKILLIHRLGIPIQSTDISWKARADFSPAQKRCCHGNLLSLRDKLLEEICLSNMMKAKNAQVFPGSVLFALDFRMVGGSTKKSLSHLNII